MKASLFRSVSIKNHSGEENILPVVESAYCHYPSENQAQFIKRNFFPIIKDSHQPTQKKNLRRTGAKEKRPHLANSSYGNEHPSSPRLICSFIKWASGNNNLPSSTPASHAQSTAMDVLPRYVDFSKEVI